MIHKRYSALIRLGVFALASSLALVACDESSKAVSYTVTFDTGAGGSPVPSQTVKRGSRATRPSTTPTRAGYVFADWHTARVGGNPFKFDITPITDNTTIYAQWRDPSSVVVLAVTYNGLPVASVGQMFTVTPQNGADLAKVTLTLTVSPGASLYEGTSTEPLPLANNALTRDYDLTQEKSFRVMAENGIATANYSIKAMVQQLSSKQIIGFKFERIYNPTLPAEIPADDIKLNEQAHTIDVQLHFGVARNGLRPTIATLGDVSVNPNSLAVQDFSAPVTYTVTAKDGSTQSYAVTVTNKAGYTVTFDLNGAPGTAPANQLVNQGEKAIAPTDPLWSGYTFEGWYTAATEGQKIDFAAGPVTTNPTSTLFAQWTVDFSQPLIVDIPDAAFRAYLQKVVPDAFDKNGKFNAHHTSVQNFTGSLSILPCEIASVQGIEYFTKATKAFLACSPNLKSIDLSKNTSLGEVIITKNDNLETLILPQGAPITTLVVRDVAQGKLKNLDLSHLPELLTLDLTNSQLTSLDLSHNTKLEKLVLEGNKLTSLDLSQYTQLGSFNALGNPLTHLDIRGLREASLGETKPLQIPADDLVELKVHLKIAPTMGEVPNLTTELKRVKTSNNKATIMVYNSSELHLTNYTESCLNYDPTHSGLTSNGKTDDRCLQYPAPQNP